MRIFLSFLFSFCFLIACDNLEITDFNRELMPTLNQFKNELIASDVGNSGTTKIIFSQNIKEFFPNMDPTLESELKELMTQKKIGAIRFYSNSCIKVNIKTYGNKYFSSSWKELCLINDDDLSDEVKCFDTELRRSIEVEDLGGGWRLVLYTQYRRIR